MAAAPQEGGTSWPPAGAAAGAMAIYWEPYPPDFCSFLQVSALAILISGVIMCFACCFLSVAAGPNADLCWEQLKAAQTGREIANITYTTCGFGAPGGADNWGLLAGSARLTLKGAAGIVAVGVGLLAFIPIIGIGCEFVSLYGRKGVLQLAALVAIYYAGAVAIRAALWWAGKLPAGAILW